LSCLAAKSRLAHWSDRIGDAEVVVMPGTFAATRSWAAKVEPVTGLRLAAVGGVVIGGVDLSQPLSPALKDQILAAFRDHQFVVFRDQVLTREQQFAFSASFGEVELHGGQASAGKRYGVAHVISNLGVDGKPVDRSSSPVSNYRWHTDKAYHAVPPMLTTLYAVEMPSEGGDTEFANTAIGYAALPPETKRRIAGLRVVFRWGMGLGETGGGGSAAQVALRERPPVDHPLVRTHPETGAKALYLGNHASHIQGLPEAEGRALLEALLEHATQREFVYGHRWRTGDLVMWDNRCLLHRAVANYDTGRERRILHRTVVRGTVPF
jgi:alpha-ketoglutarate-dependent 2,4-dichlorophenoxyacetate dioxygenase